MGKLYWRSIDDFADTPEFREFVEREFPNYAPELLVGPTRRQFLKVMGASLALAGLTGCRWPKENILPAARQRSGFTPGLPVSYASAFELGGVATGLLVTSYDGRPVKIEGNPDHPFSRGATDALAQAAILEMYCPDRSIQPASGRTNKTWDEFLTFANTHFADVRSRQGAGFCVLSEATASPSMLDLRARMTKSLPQAKWFEYEPVSSDNERVGLTQAFGKPLRSLLALDKADVIVCLDADLLLTHPAAVRYARDWAATRRAETRGLSRMHAFESMYSLTGTNADVRHPVRAIDIPIVVARLAVELAQAGVNLPAAISGAATGWRDATARAPHGAAIANLAAELAAARGKCVIAAGLRQPPEVHALVAALNEALGNVGATVSYVPELARPTHAEAIRELCTAMDDGRVETLLILGGNPVYAAPADLEFAR
jgi:molybdopterin-containing oxidoreductase family iron-sulfur binding subunit